MKMDLVAGMSRLGRWIASLDSLRLVVLGYLSYMIAGWLVLLLPGAVREGVAAGWLDHLFTAVSAVSTTGLVTVSTVDTYTGWGQFVVLLLIQLGGLGYMTVGSFIVLAASGGLSPLRARIGGAALGLPEGFDVPGFIRRMVVFTLVIEAAGAVLLYPRFLAAGADHPVWMAVFHSVSAFCTAGFGLYSNSLEDFRGDGWLNAVIVCLSLLGAVGFLVLVDAWNWSRGRSRGLTLTSKIILTGTAVVGTGGTLLFALEEPALRGLAAGETWMAAAFQVLSASTTVGFNTVPIGVLSQASVFLLIVVMLIGASPAGTGGGIKTTTVTALWSVMVSVLRGREQPTFAGREIPRARIRAATAGLVFYLIVLAAGIYGLCLLEPAPMPDLAFECASALGTVGLSRGVTGTLTEGGKWVVIVLMFAGRAGPLVIGMALWSRRSAAPPAPAEDVVL